MARPGSCLALASSMLPTIWPGDPLTFRPIAPSDLEIGAVLVYPNARGLMVAHRVVGSDSEGGTRHLHMRGDAQEGHERVPVGAVAYVVTSVSGRLGDFSMFGPRGRLHRKVAMAPSGPLRQLRRQSVALLLLVASARRRWRGLARRVRR